MSDRRLVWAVRLVFYPVALGLIALAWHQHRAGAEDAPAPPPVVTWWTGTANGEPAALAVVDGRPRTLRAPLHFACTPQLGDVWAIYAETLDARDGRVRVRERGADTTWDSGWIGTTDLDLDGRYDPRSMVASFAGRMALDANGVPASCRATRVGVSLNRPPGASGRTSQNEWVAVEARDGRVTAFSVALSVGCDDGVGRRLVWTPVLDPAGTLTVDRAWEVLGTGRFLLVRDGGAGEGGGTASFAVDGDAVHGSVSARFTLGGHTCQTGDAVTFLVQ